MWDQWSPGLAQRSGSGEGRSAHNRCGGYHRGRRQLSSRPVVRFARDRTDQERNAGAIEFRRAWSCVVVCVDLRGLHMRARWGRSTTPIRCRPGVVSSFCRICRMKREIPPCMVGGRSLHRENPTVPVNVAKMSVAHPGLISPSSRQISKLPASVLEDLPLSGSCRIRTALCPLLAL